jgi:translation initiation factor IF-1
MPERKRKPHTATVYFVLEEYLVTALVPSETACLASSPGRMRRTLVWISREEMVLFLLYAASLEASVATRSKISGMRSQKTRLAKRVERGAYR